MKPSDTEIIIEQYKNRIADLEKDVKISKAQFRLLGLMTHELRTYLGPIIGFSRLLLEETSLDETQTEYVNSLLNSGGYPLLGTVNDFADFLKLIEEKTELEKSSTSVQALLDGATKKFSSKAEKEVASFAVSVDSGISKSINCDGIKVKQILSELIGNVMKFTTTGKVEIRLSISQTASIHFLNFEIASINTNALSESLEPVEQFINSPNYKVEVNSFVYISLGLMNAKMLCDLMDGRIWLHNEIGKGLVFHFAIPYEPD